MLPFGHGNFPSPRTAGGRVLEQIAASHHATPRQVALRFLMRWPTVFAIPKAIRGIPRVYEPNSSLPDVILRLMLRLSLDLLDAGA
jgi:hypothetical protein